MSHCLYVRLCHAMTKANKFLWLFFSVNTLVELPIKMKRKETAEVKHFPRAILVTYVFKFFLITEIYSIFLEGQGIVHPFPLSLPSTMLFSLSMYSWVTQAGRLYFIYSHQFPHSSVIRIRLPFIISHFPFSKLQEKNRFKFQL